MRTLSKPVIGALGLILVASAVVLAACNKPPPPGSLKVGYQNSPAMALIMIADAKGYYKDHKVDVDLQEFTAGKLALHAFIGGSLDVAVAGEVPVGLALLQSQHFSVVGEVLSGSKDEMRMIVRAPGGCGTLTPEKYFTQQKRRIGTSFGGGPQYFTFQFLNAHGISSNQVELISQKPEEMPTAVSRGAVDAIAIFDPAAAEAERLLGPDHCTFPDPGTYRQHYVVVVKDGAVKGRGDTRTRGFLAALRDAEQFADANPAEAQKIVAAKTRLPITVVEQIWPRYQFGVVLDPGLKQLWIKQAEWHKAQPGSATLSAPDYDAVLNRMLLSNE